MESLIADHATADCCYCACALKKMDAGREYNKWQMFHSKAVFGYIKFGGKPREELYCS